MSDKVFNKETEIVVDSPRFDAWEEEANRTRSKVYDYWGDDEIAFVMKHYKVDLTASQIANIMKTKTTEQIYNFHLRNAHLDGWKYQEE